MGRKILRIFIFLILIITSFTLICFGVYFNKISKPRYLYRTGIDVFTKNIDNFIQVDDKYILNNSYTIDGVVDFNISSDIYTLDKVNNEIDLEKSKLINNYNNLNIKYSISQNFKDKKLLLKLNENLKDEKLLEEKYYIFNSTKYFFVNGILSNYINEGSNNYFESISSDNTLNDNINYLYNFILDSISDNMEQDAFNTYTEININNKDLRALKISYDLNNKSYIDLLNGILDDLKNDEKSYKILSSIDVNFKKRKVSNKNDFLNSNEKYYINVYCDSRIYKPLKYEIVYHNKNDIKSYSYEGDYKKGLFYYSSNGNLEYKANLNANSRKVEITVYDKLEKKVGDIKIDNRDKSFNLDLRLNKNSYNLEYTSNISNFKKNTSYNNNIILNFKFIKDKENAVNGKININNYVMFDSKIDEDVSNAILKSTLNEETNNKLDNLYNSVLERMKK